VREFPLPWGERVRVRGRGRGEGENTFKKVTTKRERGIAV